MIHVAGNAWRICLVVGFTALASFGCANFQLPRINPSGDSVFIWPGRGANPALDPGVAPPFVPPSPGTAPPFAPPTFNASPGTRAPAPGIAPPGMIGPPATPGATNPAVVGAPQLSLQLFGPQTALVGSEVRFEVEVSNRGTAAATGLLITDRFDAGLDHAASSSPIERDLPDLGAGASTRIAVTFRVARTGQLCHDVTVTGTGGLRASGRGCVTALAGSPSAPAIPTTPPLAAPPATSPGTAVQPGEPAPFQPQPSEQQPPTTPPLGTSNPSQPPAQPTFDSSQANAGARPNLVVNMTGPPRRKVDEIAEFVIEVTNTGTAPLTNVRIVDHYELSLEPVQATLGFDQAGGALTWNVASIAPGKSVKRQLNCRCIQQVNRACNRVTVSADGGISQGDEVCLEVVTAEQPPQAEPAAPAAVPAKAAGSLSLAVAEQVDPVRIGGDTTYQIVLTNKGDSSAKDVTVVANVPQEMSLLGVGGPHGARMLPDSARFYPIRELRAGESVTLEVRVKARRTGTARFEVQATSEGQTSPVIESETTQILDGS